MKDIEENIKYLKLEIDPSGESAALVLESTPSYAERLLLKGEAVIRFEYDFIKEVFKVEPINSFWEKQLLYNRTLRTMIEGVLKRLEEYRKLVAHARTVRVCAEFTYDDVVEVDEDQNFLMFHNEEKPVR